MPVVNTLVQTRPSAAAKISQQQPLEVTEHPGRWWLWNGHSTANQSLVPIILAPATKTTFLVLWQALFLYQIIRFSRGIYRVHRLRKDAIPISPSGIGIAAVMAGIIAPSHRVVLLQSATIDDPVTIGVFRPAILLPSEVIPALNQTDFAVILAHEYGHIRRKDFLVCFLCQLTALPVAWHPGIQYLMSSISKTRELACDDYAAARIGKRIGYARTLLRLASLCLQAPRSSAIGLGIFDGDNLEDRIMMLTQKPASLSRAGLLGLALATSFLFGSSTVLARAVSLQAASASTNTTQTFAGAWHWMFHGQSFATMILVQDGSTITGTVTPSHIALDEDGYLNRADPTDDTTPSPITRTRLEGNALRVAIGEGSQAFEFLVTLKDATHAEIHPIGAPPNMKPIQAERVP